MSFRKMIVYFAFCAILLAPTGVRAMHPLITDDTGTQGKGKFQLEVNGQYDTDKETVEGATIKTTGWQVAGALSFGVIDSVDIIVGVPYLWTKVKEDGVVTSKEHGFSDTKLDMKWRFFSQEGYSVAVKYGMTFPSGNDNRGLGTGKIGQSAFFIVSEERGPVAFHLNLGYIRNENTMDERVDIWHTSFAATYELVKGFKLAGNVGIERNRDKNSATDPAYVLGGVIYSLTGNFDLDFGVKYGLSRTEADWSYLGGITLRF